ncbi:GNAT family N-acetyltransferase [Melittangium boletus]|uniref:GNAT family N-acetyltransferase n=1 Tax=Melittangium boletus DSM 14713 TaxID=1294270 RepID=A0A250IEA6_9BACT|nr:GNAT family N-acetyltransferase [Melittangium boletus]ATB29492.1 GNAT family N-acetyltransferase [Melittangium boletus DSM 14713]
MTDAELHALLRTNLLAFKALQMRTSALQGLDVPGVRALCLAGGAQPFFQQQVLYAWPGALGPQLDAVEAWYLARQVHAWRVGVTPGDTDAETALTRTGYQREDGMPAMGRTLEYHPPPSLPLGLTLERPDDLDAVMALNGQCYEPSSMDFLDAWRRAPLPDARIHAVLAREGGRALACSLSFEHEGCAGIYMVATHPDARRRGLGALVMEALHADAFARGCTTAVLQASAHGVSLYQRLGYRSLGTWVNWVRRVPGIRAPPMAAPG